MAHRREAPKSADPGAGPRLETEEEMNLTYVVGSVLAAGLLIYLMYALLKPERF